MKKLAMALVGLAVSGPAQAQNMCWVLDRQLDRFVRAEEDRLAALSALERSLVELERAPPPTRDIPEIARSVTLKLGEQRELTRELVASVNRLRVELQECSRAR